MLANGKVGLANESITESVSGPNASQILAENSPLLLAPRHTSLTRARFYYLVKGCLSWPNKKVFYFYATQFFLTGWV